MLNDDPQAVLVDCRTDAEWRFVGVPDLTGLGRDVVYVEWNRTDGSRNDGFVDDLVAAGVDARRSAGGVPVPLGQPLDRRRRGRHRSGHRAVVQRAGRVRGRPRRATSTAAAPAGGPSACPGSSHDRRDQPVPSVRIPARNCRGRQPGHHRSARRPVAVGLRRDRRGDLPDLGLRLRERGRGGEGVHRRDRPVRVLAVRQPDDLDVRGAAAADRGRARGVRDGDRNGRGVHLAGCAAGRG